MFAGLLSLCTITAHIPSRGSLTPPDFTWRAVTCVCYTAAVLAKPAALPLVTLIIALEYFYCTLPASLIEHAREPQYVRKRMNFAFKNRNCGFKTRKFVFKMMNFAASARRVGSLARTAGNTERLEVSGGKSRPADGLRPADTPGCPRKSRPPGETIGQHRCVFHIKWPLLCHFSTKHRCI